MASRLRMAVLRPGAACPAGSNHPWLVFIWAPPTSPGAGGTCLRGLSIDLVVVTHTSARFLGLHARAPTLQRLPPSHWRVAIVPGAMPPPVHLNMQHLSASQGEASSSGRVSLAPITLAAALEELTVVRQELASLAVGGAGGGGALAHCHS